MDYATLTDTDKLLLARDTLRGRESDHFRISLLDEPNKEVRLSALETEIEAIRSTVDDLEAADKKATAAAEKKAAAESKAQQEAEDAANDDAAEKPKRRTRKAAAKDEEE